MNSFGFSYSRWTLTGDPNSMTELSYLDESLLSHIALLLQYNFLFVSVIERFSFSRISTLVQSSPLTNDDLSLLQNSCGVLGNFCSIPKGIRSLRQLSILPSIITLITHALSLNSQRSIDVLLWSLENIAASPDGSEQIQHSQLPFALIHSLLHPYLQYDEYD